MIGLACLSLAAVPAARADFITYPSVGTYGFSSANTPYSAEQSVQQFDPSLGTLESMQFSVSETVSGTVSLWSTVANQSVTKVSYKGYLYATIPGAGNSTLIDGSVNNLVLNQADSIKNLITSFTSIPQETGPGTPPAGALVKSFSGLNASSSTYTFTAATTSDQPGNAFPGGSLLNDFTGTGTTAVDLYALGNVSITTAGNVHNAYSDDVTGTLSVTYDYIPAPPSVPDSGSWVIDAMMFGVLVVGMRRSFCPPGWLAGLKS